MEQTEKTWLGEKIETAEKKWPHFRVTMLSALAFGVLAHGMALFNKFSMVDDPQFLFSVGVTFRSGRWFLGMLGALVQWLFGSPNFSLPLFSGLACIALLGLCACVLIDLLELRGKADYILVPGLMVTLPVVAGFYCYLFTAPYYLFGLLLTLSGCSVLCRNRKLWAYLAGVVLLALSAGIYQAFIPTALCVFLLYFLRQTAKAESWSIGKLLGEIAWYVSACLCFLALYTLANKLCLQVLGLSMTGYNGLSEPVSGGIGVYMGRIKLSYYLFLKPDGTNRSAYMYPFRLLTLYYVNLTALALTAILYVWRRFRENWVRGLSAGLALCVFPLAVNFIYVMCAPKIVHSLMVYSQLFFWLLPWCFLRWEPIFREREKQSKIAARFVCALLAVVCLMYVRYDNVVYLRMDLYQTRTIQYFTTIITQVKSLDGYKSDLKLTFINKDFNKDPTFVDIPEFTTFAVEPILQHTAELTAHSFREFLSQWCGFDAEIVDEGAYRDLPEVQQMPSYPDAGSIRIIGDTVVIKF